MNLAYLALAFVFAAVAMTFLSRARTAADPKSAKGRRLAGILLLVAGGLFLVAFAASALRSG